MLAGQVNAALFVDTMQNFAIHVGLRFWCLIASMEYLPKQKFFESCKMSVRVTFHCLMSFCIDLSNVDGQWLNNFSSCYG